MSQKDFRDVFIICFNRPEASYRTSEADFRAAMNWPAHHPLENLRQMTLIEDRTTLLPRSNFHINFHMN